MAAHDIKSPLVVIRGLAELIMHLYKTYLPEKANNYLQKILNRSDYIVNIVDDYLDYSKIETGKLKLNVTSNNYTEIINEVIDFQRLILKRKISIILNITHKIPLIYIDKDKIIQVLNNIIGNSIKYSEEHTTITINVFKDKKYLITEIIDQGVGIPNDKLSMIFNSYGKIGTATLDGSKSTGLGLAIVKKIIDCHKGFIEVSSEKEAGTSFVFKLPIKKK